MSTWLLVLCYENWGSGKKLVFLMKKTCTLLITSSLYKRCCFGGIFFQKSKDSIQGACQNLQKQSSTGAQKAFK